MFDVNQIKVLLGCVPERLKEEYQVKQLEALLDATEHLYSFKGDWNISSPDNVTINLQGRSFTIPIMDADSVASVESMINDMLETAIALVRELMESPLPYDHQVFLMKEWIKKSAKLHETSTLSDIQNIITTAFGKFDNGEMAGCVYTALKVDGTIIEYDVYADATPVKAQSVQVKAPVKAIIPPSRPNDVNW